jgi:Xaa-Pro dipeptidase
LDLHLHYLKVTKQDSTETPYGNIVAQGAHASVLHHVHYTKEAHTKADESLLVDAGANYMGYASDITRTTVRGQSQAARDFRALIAGTEALEIEIVSEVKPGIAYQDLHNQAHYKVARLLVECGLCEGPLDALVDQGVTRVFLPHGLGHSLGLQVHDVGCKLVPPAETNQFLRNTSTITEGQVFTIEPGIYFVDGLLADLRNSPASALVSWESVEALRPFGGIRIEDNLAVTAEGSINLTRDNWPAKH